MDFLGIGPLELAFILLIALIVLGPKDMVKAGKTIGRVLRNIVTSDNWRTIQQASKEVKDLPNRLMREAGLDDIQNQLPDAEVIRRDIGLNELEEEAQKAQDDLADGTTTPSDAAPLPESPLQQNPVPENPFEDSSPVENTPPETSPEGSSTAEPPAEEPTQPKIDISDNGPIHPPDIDNKTDINDSST